MWRIKVNWFNIIREGQSLFLFYYYILGGGVNLNTLSILFEDLNGCDML